jgi:hypothetical protein
MTLAFKRYVLGPAAALVLVIQIPTTTLKAQTKSSAFQALIRRGTVESIGQSANAFADTATTAIALPNVLIIANGGCRFTILDRRGDTKNANGWMFRGNAGDLDRAVVATDADRALVLELHASQGESIRRAPWVVKDSVLAPSEFSPVAVARVRFSPTSTPNDRERIIKIAQRYIDECAYLW